MSTQYIVDSFRCENALGDLGSLCKLCQNYFDVVEEMQPVNILWFHNKLAEGWNQ